MMLQLLHAGNIKQKLQLLHRCRNTNGFSDEWIEIHTEFIAKSDYNGFGIGAAQLLGKSAYFMIDYIYIIKE